MPRAIFPETKTQSSPGSLSPPTGSTTSIFTPKKDPEDRVSFRWANPLNYLFFNFIYNTMKQAHKLQQKGETLNNQELLEIPSNKRPDVMGNKLLEFLEEQKRCNKKMSLGQAILTVYRGQFLFILCLQITFIFLRVFSVWIMQGLIDSLSDQTLPVSDGFKWAGILCTLMLMTLFVEHHCFYLCTMSPIYVKAGLISLIYQKVIKMSIYSLNKISLGKIVNIVANDVNVFERTGFLFTSLVTGGVALLSSGVMLWFFFGPSCLVGLGYLLFGYPLQQLLVKLASKSRELKNIATDQRVKLTNEIIDGIRLLKMYTWEMIFRDSINDIRKNETRYLKKIGACEGASRGIAFSTQAVASFLIFLTYSLTGQELKVSSVFPTLFIIGFLRIHAVLFFANSLNFLAEAKLLFARIIQIIATPEIIIKPLKEPNDSSNAIEFENFKGYWAKREDNNEFSGSASQIGTLNSERLQLTQGNKPVLNDITLNIPKGSTTAVIGRVGSGKSSLLLSLTGEMPYTRGEIRCSGKIAFVEQEPTIFSGTIKENVLFGKEYDATLYEKVIEACCLVNDIKQFPKGDFADIGEKGINLSGGQKARLALARALYSDADIYLLDDPLSAVDTKVAQMLFQNAILGFLQYKTVILATHQVHFVKELQNILVLEDGILVGAGNYQGLKASGVDVNGIFNFKNRKDLLLSPISASPLPTSSVTTKKQNRLSIFFAHVDQDDRSFISREENEEEKDEDVNLEEEENDEEVNKEKKEETNKEKYFTLEDKYIGNVSFKTYIDYIQEMGSKPLLIIAFILISGTEGANVAFGRLLGAWTGGDLDKTSSYIVIGVLTGCIVMIYIIKNIVFNFMMLRASGKLHNKMSNVIVKASVQFFDTNSVGRILNRFSNDVGVLDRAIPLTLIEVVEVSFTTISQILTVAVISPFTLLSVGIVSVGVYFLIKFCYEPIKQCRNYDLTTRSPLYSQFSSTLSGLLIIRSYDQQKNFEQRFKKALEDNTKGSLSFWMCSRFFGFYSDFLSIISAMASIFIITGIKSENPGLSGLSLSYILSIAGVLQFGLRQAVQTNVLMASIARIQSYCNIPCEAEHSVPSDIEHKNWPEKGSISFNKVSMKYQEDADYVIKGLSFDVKPGEKIACIGRTGAGKSSLIQILFRMIEIEKEKEGELKDSSSVKIDNVDIRSLGLHLLRNSISIIPQIPFIFSGTLRKNLDPLNNYSDQDLWRVLDDVGLKDYINTFERKLDTDMNNASSFFSVGQKQLICLARAILRKSKILVLDEATANVDVETDSFIQFKIMEKFKGCTIFTIAHRLSTVANYDKILVLEKGEVVEFDVPYKLLVKTIGDQKITREGHFSSMVANAGSKVSQLVFKVAKLEYFRKFGQEQNNRGK